MSQTTTKSARILELVNKTLELPTIPEVLVRLNSVLAKPNSSADDVAKVILADPAIATNVLRLVNSAYFGLQVKVTSVTTAVSVMGFKMTKKVALKAAVLSVFGRRQDDVPHFKPDAFWQHSIFTGIAARSLGKQCDQLTQNDGEDLYICGLLHDVGKIILLENATARYLQVLQQAAATHRSELEVENDLLGYSHADVGSVLAIKWSLPEDLTIAIRYHHAPAQDPFHQSLSSLIHLADHIAWTAGHSSTHGTTPPRLDPGVYAQLGLDPSVVERQLPEIREDYAATSTPR